MQISVRVHLDKRNLGSCKRGSKSPAELSQHISIIGYSIEKANIYRMWQVLFRESRVAHLLLICQNYELMNHITDRWTGREVALYFCSALKYERLRLRRLITCECEGKPFHCNCLG